MKKLFIPLLLVVVLLSSCTNFTQIGNKVYQNAFGNITPAINSTFNIGTPTHYYDSAYIEHLYTSTGVIGASNVTTVGGSVDYIPKFNAPTNLVDSNIKDNTTAVYINDKLNLQGDVYTDRWLNQNTNTLVGVGVVGNNALSHTGGVEGQGNTALGYETLHDITTSYYNTAIGYYALRDLTSGIYNTALGQGALGDVTVGNFNTAIGMQALNKNTGSYNTALGLFAGHTNISGDDNIFIGAQAGKNELGSSKLYIESSDSPNPLIYGNFANDTVVINNQLSTHGNITVNSNYINNLSNPSLAQDAATKGYVDSTVSSIALGNVFTVAKSGAPYTSIQAAINAAAPISNVTNPTLVRIAPGVYNESITCAPYVNIATVSGSADTVVIQQNDADLCTLSGGTNEISGITFRLVTPTAARTIIKDNGVASTCTLINIRVEITTPSTYAHKLIAISGSGTTFAVVNYIATIGGTGASVGLDISAPCYVVFVTVEMTFNNANAYNFKCTSSGATVVVDNGIITGTCNLLNVTGGTFRWTSCKLDSSGTNIVNTNAVHIVESSFINAPLVAQNGAEVRLRESSYKFVYRQGTGNIIDTTRKLQSGIYHVVDYTWNTAIASANVYVRKSGTGDIQTGGSGQGVMGVRMNSVSYVGVENNADVTGGLDSSFNCTRTIRMQQTLSISSLDANGKIFMGVRQTVGNAIPTLAGAENYAGFVWDGTSCKLQSSNGGGVGQSTTITSPPVGVQHFIEIEILGSNRVDFYCDGVLLASHSTAAGLPSGMVDWQRLITSDGGGGAGYMYMTLRNGSIMECPQ